MEGRLVNNCSYGLQTLSRNNLPRMALKTKIVKRILIKTILAKLCCLVWLIFSPILALVLVVITCLFIIRKLVDFVVLKRNPNWKPVQALNSVFAAGLGLCVGNIATVFVLETEFQNISIENIRKAFRTRVLNAEGDPFWKLKFVPQKLFGFYYWTPSTHSDDTLSDHIRGLPQMTKLEDDLDDFLTNHWLSTSFNGKSPWEIIVVEANRGTKLCIRINQVIGGSDTIGRIVDALNGNKVHDSMATNQGIKFWSMISMAYNLLMLPSTLFHTARGAFWIEKLSLISKSVEQVFAAHVVQVNTVDRIARHFKCPFRTVLASTLGSAIRCFELENTAESALPVHSQILMNYSSSTLNSNTTSCYVKYPLKCANTGDRMSKTHEDVQFSLTNGLDSFRFYFRHLTYILPTFVLKMMVGTSASISICSSTDNEIPRDNHSRVFDYVLKNSYELVGLYGTKTGCLMKYTTAGKTIPFSIHADKERIPTNEAARRVCEYFEQELEYLEEFVDTGEEYLHFPVIRIESHKQLLAGIYAGYINVGLSYPDIL